MLETQASVTAAMPMSQTALHDSLRKLDDTARSPFLSSEPAALNVALRAVRAPLTAHFWFEEQSGYLDSMVEREPRLDRRSQGLLDDHGQLLRSLNSLIEEAGSKQNSSDVLRRKVRSWIKAFRKHESGENDMVGDAFNLDIGAED